MLTHCRSLRQCLLLAAVDSLNRFLEGVLEFKAFPKDFVLQSFRPKQAARQHSVPRFFQHQIINYLDLSIKGRCLLY